MQKSAGKYPFFLYLLPVSFVLHGCLEHFKQVPFRDASFLILYYLLVALLLHVLCWPLFRSFRKAAVAALLLLLFQFYFGSVQDQLQSKFPGYLISRYSFLIPAMLLLLIGLIILLKRIKQLPARLLLYLNTVMLILILADGFLFITQKRKKEQASLFNPLPEVACDSCMRPDIYLLLADGYAGHKQLADLFSYNNSPFEQELVKRGFHIIDSSRSNYNYTAFSMASLLNMDYLKGIRGNNNDQKDIAVCFSALRQNRFVNFLENRGYRFFNHSIFEFEGAPSPIRSGFFPQKTLLITSQTFTRRVARDLWYHLATSFHIPSVIRSYKNADRNNNEKLFGMTMKEAARNRDQPKFVYTHLMMPHHPLYFDSAGHAYPLEKLVDGHYYDKKMRIGYIQYSNRELLRLVDGILANSVKPPVIFLLGDHGIRESKEPVDPAYSFFTLDAILLPGRDYHMFAKGMTHVNFLRTFLNTVFSQKLPLLPDSTTFIIE